MPNTRWRGLLSTSAGNAPRERYAQPSRARRIPSIVLAFDVSRLDTRRMADKIMPEIPGEFFFPARYWMPSHLRHSKHRTRRTR